MDILKKINLHNNLPDLQGGTASEMYHLTDGEYSDVQKLIDGAPYAGAVTKPTYIDNDNGTLTLNSSEYSLYTNATFGGLTQRFIIEEATTTLTPGVLYLMDNTINYIVVNYNGGDPRYEVIQNVELITESDILPHLTVFRSGNILRLLSWDAMGSGLANKLHQRIVKTRRFERESGLILSETSDPVERTVIVSEGKCWNGVNRTIFEEENSSEENIVQWNHVAGVWTNSQVAQYDNFYYDNGTNLVEMTTNRWKVLWFYRCKADNYKTVSYVFGNGQYHSSAAAADESAPVNLPTPVSLSAILVGRIIIKKEATSGIVSSAFDTIYPDTQIMNHNDAANIQGGIVDEYYHLSADEYTNAQNLISSGSGSLFLSDDGTYKSISASDTIQVQILSEGDEIGEGYKGTKYINNNIYIDSVILSCDSVCNITMNVQVNDIIYGTASLVNESYMEDSILNDWNRNMSANNFIKFYVTEDAYSVSSPMNVILILNIKII
jgi:hypothetical protein